MTKTLTLDIDSSRAGLSEAEIGAISAETAMLPAPAFASYRPDSAAIERLKEKFGAKKNIIIEGNGGSISTIRAFWNCFGNDAKNVFLLDTDDPDYIAQIKAQCPADDTLLIVTSKSGESINALADYLALRAYATVFVTGDQGTLHEISEAKQIPTLKHPDISGRFSGITECALFPAAMLDMDIDAIQEGARAAYDICAPTSAYADNPALQLAAHLDKLEKLGYTELFLSIYSKKVNGFFELITQLFHESVCKGDNGQSIYGGEAPENQHHTLQRFNFGRKNCAGLFLTVDHFQGNAQLEVPPELKDIPCRNLKLAKLDQLSLQDIIHTEFDGTWKDTIEKEIPAIRLNLSEISPFSAGMLTAFFQYAAYYSSILHRVNPFDQPGVERSKEYIFQLIAEK